MRRRLFLYMTVATGCFGAARRASGATAQERKKSEPRGSRIEVREGIYMIVATHSGLALNIPGALKHQGRMVAQAAQVGNQALKHQQFRFMKVGKFYRIQAVVSGLFIEVAEGWKFDGALVVQWPERNVDHQLFSFRDAGGGNVRIVAKHSGKCLEVIGGWKTPSAAVVQWSEHDGSHQVFTLKPVALAGGS